MKVSRGSVSILLLGVCLFATSCASTRPATDGYVVLESHKFMCGAAKGLG